VEETVTQKKSSRRDFCVHTGQGLSAVALGVAFGSVLQGCNTFTYPTPVQGLQTLNGSEANGSVSLTVSAASPLAAVGGAALVPSSAGPLLVVRSTADSFTALNGTCTHRVCTITGYVNQTFVCPCHGSEFDTSGSVVQGPARVALQQHATHFADSVLTIQL
jgi:cytochrome b6-f complex iron-sulfur subunit